MTGAEKLVLGTVQFGCRYGINSAGRPDAKAVNDIAVAAFSSGVSLLDTSSAYGESEDVLGSCEACRPFGIVSKYPKGGGGVAEAFETSLRRLGRTSLYGYLLHHFDVWKENPGIWDDFLCLRDTGRVSKIGFSLYSPEELDMILEKGVEFDLLQIPRNVFDRKFDTYLKELCESGVEIHVRSTFLQGLFFKDRDSLPERLKPMRKYLEALDRCAADNNMGIHEIALNFNVHNPYVGGVLVGVDNVAQLRSNIIAIGDRAVDPGIDVAETALLNPVNWN
ncbi:MAG: aldo/keto reductase [Bacteroidales bacterium]|nr:aldo/keto reductase [Bacteroidales bacterium]